MPKECTRCGHVADDEEIQQCPSCGAEGLRYSLLAGLNIAVHDVGDEIAVAKPKSDLPTFGDYFQHGLQTVLVHHALSVPLIAAAVGIFIFGLRVEPKNILTECPGGVAAAGYVVPLLAAVLSTWMGLRGVVFAQFTGAVAGAVACLAQLAERQALSMQAETVAGLAPQLEQWLLLPAGGAMLGFSFGLAIAGAQRAPVEDDKEVKYRSTTTWNKKAKPGFQEIFDPRSNTPQRVAIGIVAGLVVSQRVLGYVFSVILFGAPAARLAAIMDRVETIWLGVMFLVAGMVAGAGAKTGTLNGLFAGIGMTLLMIFYAYMTQAEMTRTDYATLAGLAIAVGPFGGYFGRVVFPPYRFYRGPQDAPSNAKPTLSQAPTTR